MTTIDKRVIIIRWDEMLARFLSQECMCVIEHETLIACACITKIYILYHL